MATSRLPRFSSYRCILLASQRAQYVSRIGRPQFVVSFQRTTRSRQYSTPHSSPTPPDGPLAGVRVLDFTRILAGPFCTQVLADYGADVIKVELPGKGDETRSWKAAGEASFWKDDIGPLSLFYSAINRGKRSITLDLKRPQGLEAVKRLVSDGKIDVLIENFVPGTTDRLGFGYDVLSKLNPRLIYASISGYGSTGPYAKHAGYDAIAAAEAAFMHLNGHPDQPPARAPLGMTDMSTGLFTHGAIMAALYSREKTGRGQYISASLFETQIAMLVNVGGNWLNRNVEGKRYGAAHPSTVPYNAWRCADGIYIVIAANSDTQFANLCRRIGREELISDPRFVKNAKRVENRKAIDDTIQSVLGTKTSEEWMQILDGSGLAHGPVNSVEKAFQHPQIPARDMVVSLKWDALAYGELKTIGVPVKFSETKGRVKNNPARLGEHNEPVLAEAGYGADEIEKLKSEGVF